MTAYLLLILTVLLGSLLAEFISARQKVPVKFLLTFSGAYLLSLGIFHLLPEIYEGHQHAIGLWVMGGFFIQLVLEVFSKGIEHGHGHVEHFSKGKLPVAILVSLFIHAFLESLPIGAHSDHHSREALMWGIIIHKLPVSIILYSMLRQLSDKRWLIALMMAVFAAIAPLGVLVAEWINFLGDWYRELTALTFGLFLHISTTILFESTQSHRFNLMKFSTILLAVAVAWFSVSH